jgi:hypothetical protein
MTDDPEFKPKQEHETKYQYVDRVGIKKMSQCESCEFHVYDVDRTACIGCVKDYLINRSEG